LLRPVVLGVLAGVVEVLQALLSWIGVMIPWGFAPHLALVEAA
jgi:hypothetical protein